MISSLEHILDETQGLRRLLGETLGVERQVQVDWEIEPSCLGTWWRPSFEPNLFPYIPSHVKTAKERRQVFVGQFQRLLKLETLFRNVVNETFSSPSTKSTIRCSKEL